MKKTLFICVIASALLAACSGGVFEKEKKYTPVYLYYNPLSYGAIDDFLEQSDLALTINYPNFVNYPNDWAKTGLRGNVSFVKYPSQDFSGRIISSGGGVTFDNAGKMLSIIFYNSGSIEVFYEFQYDELGRLTGTVKEPIRHKWAKSTQGFEYDSEGKLIKRIKPSAGIRHRDFTYYEDGTLKSNVPVINDDYAYKGSSAGIMEFNEAGELERTEAPQTSNIFISEAKNYHNEFNSVCTFKYSNGLCIEKMETIYWKEEHRVLDTIICYNRYTYNDKGDIVNWQYDGGYYYEYPENRNKYSIRHATFDVGFDYVYDNHDNWTTMRTLLPENFKVIYALKKHFGKRYKTIEEGKAVFTTTREIEYHAFTAEEAAEMAAKAKEERKKEIKKNTPKYTAVQGRGLYGDVKSVSYADHTITFDEYGNIVKEWDEYKYESPTRYKIGDVIGPFNIICKGNLRKEEDENRIEPTIEYEFDKKGRVIRYKYAQGMSPVEETYTYEGSNKYPSSMRYEAGYEDGTDIAMCKYIYLEFDKQGNWTKRKVNRSWECTEIDAFYNTQETTTKTDPEFEETRTITYY